MKKLLLLWLHMACITAYALPTYEPFTEYSALVTAGGGSVDLGTSGFYVTNNGTVEQWGGGSSGFGLFFSAGTPTATAYQEVLVTNNPATVFTSANLATILPSGFPGAGDDINITAYIPQNTGSDTPGNSAVFKFAQDIPRPTNGVTTLYVSYLLNCSTEGTTVGAGNVGRYAGFLSQSNIYEGTGSGGAYPTWANLFNTFSATGPNYVSYGQKTGPPTFTGGNNILPSDSSAGNAGGTGIAGVGVVYATANFVIGRYSFSSNNNDTNTVWVNPPVSDFGGATPSSANYNTYKMTNVMSDVGAFFMESRSGASSGGNSPSFVGNLLIGTTWSYVTGGPEFTNQPTSATIYSTGGTVTFSGGAVAAAQTVSYQWQHVAGGTTNILTDGVGTAGGGATVSGSGTDMLTLTGVTAGDAAGLFQLVATASGTGFKLASQPVGIITDPEITGNPASLNLNYGQTATFTASATTAQPTMSYQWYLGSTPLSDGVQADSSTISGSSGTVAGQTLTTTLTIANVSYLDQGNYSVILTNNDNFAVQSAPGSLAVNDPIIVVQPTPAVIPLGGTGSISVGAAGTGVTYHWHNSGGLLSDGGDFSGTATATLTITDAQSSDADNGFFCVVRGSSGQKVDSASVAVSVEIPLGNGVDPNNLGQGDWIWEMPLCETALGVSTPQAVIDYEAGRGMQWVTVKAGDGTSEWSQWNSTIINEAHAKGMKIFAWVYAYGNYTNTTSGIYSSEAAELNVAKWALSVGGDGLIIDAESEYEGQGAVASAYASGIKAAYPNLFLAYAPFPYISYHSTFPYVQFGKNCDAVMPQAYWADIGVTVTNMVQDMDGEWSAWQNSLTGSNTNAIKPIIPIGQGWNFTGYTESASEVTNFVYLLKNDPAPAGRGGYHGVSYWECSQHPAAVWTGMAKSLILAGTNSVIVSQGSNATFAVNLPSGGKFQYQWQFNQNNIAAATNSSLTITNAQLDAAGSYSVLVSNTNGCAMNYSVVMSVVSPLVNLPGSVVAPMNMVNWWTADGNLCDIYGVFNATPQNGIYFTNGEVGLAVHLDGATGFLNVSASSLAPPWTICLWVNREDAPGNSAALFSDDSTNVLKLEQYNGTREVGVTVQGVADYTFPGGYSVPQNTWTHLAFVDDGSTIELYANGVFQGSLAVSFPLPRAYIGLDSFVESDTIGSETNRKFTDYLRGSLDEIQVFQRALGASEISTIYNAGSAGLVRAPEFTGIAIIPGGIQLNMCGQTGKSLTLYDSTDLMNWNLLGTISNPTGAIQYLDSSTAPQKFYRATQP